MSWTYRCLIIEDSQVEMARTLTATIAGPSGSNMWTTALTSKDDPNLITHWISAGLLQENFANLMPLSELDEDANLIVISEGQSNLAHYLANKAGMQVTIEEIQAVFAASSVTKENPQDALYRLNLIMLKESSLDL